MWRFTLSLLAGSLLTSAGAAKSDLDLFQGTWKVAREQRLPEYSPRPKGVRFAVFEGNNLTWQVKDAQIKTIFRIDPAKKNFDLQGKLWELPVWFLGCYKLNGDVLVIRIGEQGKRPRFGQLDSGETEWILVREKPAN